MRRLAFATSVSLAAISAAMADDFGSRWVPIESTLFRWELGAESKSTAKVGLLFSRDERSFWVPTGMPCAVACSAADLGLGATIRFESDSFSTYLATIASHHDFNSSAYAANWITTPREFLAISAGLDVNLPASIWQVSVEYSFKFGSFLSTSCLTCGSDTVGSSAILVSVRRPLFEVSSPSLPASFDALPSSSTSSGRSIRVASPFGIHPPPDGSSGFQSQAAPIPSEPKKDASESPTPNLTPAQPEERGLDQ
jgi:hypothetical protein